MRMWTISLLSVRKMGRVREDADTSENRCSTSQSELDGTRVAKLFSRMLVENSELQTGKCGMANLRSIRACVDCDGMRPPQCPREAMDISLVGKQSPLEDSD